MRPDVIVRLPGGKYVVVDAKVPLDAYLRALEAPDEAARQSLLADHARQVRAHIMQLSAKGYAANVHPSPDLVVMFLQTLTDGFTRPYRDSDTFTGMCMSGGSARTQGNQFLIPTPPLPPCAPEIWGVPPLPFPPIP